MEPLTNRQISALVALIKATANTIESHFTDSSLLSLDSLYSHALGAAISSPPLNDAVHILEGACAQLCATLARPSHTVLNRATQFFEPICLNVVITFKIPDILQERPLGMHIKEIGEKAGVDHEKLGQIMRLLATKHIFREVATDLFANNRLSIQLVSSNPLAGYLSFYNEINKAAMMIVDVLSNSNQKKIEQSAWNRMTGFDGSLFEYFEEGTPEGAKQGGLFALGLRGWNDAVQAAAVLSDFPWGKYPAGTIVNDVGGGIGTMAMELIKAFPNLLLKLQDRPDRIHQAEMEVWPELLPSAIAEKRIEFKAIDFFVDSPIEGCDVYY
ncbi:Sterigmatocystin 8-O-methyltransferase, partial [Termitomyces sp. T112]